MQTIYLFYITLPAKDIIMNDCVNKIKDNYSFYTNLLEERKSIFSEVIEVQTFLNKKILEENIPVKHPEVVDDMILIVDVSVNNYKYFKFKLRYKEYVDKPLFRFDSDGVTHWNNIDGIPLTEQQVKTPHFHKFNESGIEVAYQTIQLKNEETKKALQDIESCIAHFFHECNIRVNTVAFPTIKVNPNQLDFTYEKNDPNENVKFL
jgi:hypothetical protein